MPELLSRHYGLSPVVFRKHWRPHDGSLLRSPAVAALVLSRCDLDHETSSSELEQLLSDSALTLTTLIVHGCRMRTRFWERVGELLLTSDAALACLSVRRTAICRDGALALANGLRGNTTLRDLDFGETEVGKEGGEEILAMALRGNGSLRRLEVGQERLGRGGGLVVATMLKQNSALQALSLGANAMGPTAGEALAQAMERNCGLKTLVLMANQLGKECGKALGKALGSNSTLTALTVGPNRIGSEGGEAIARGLCGNASLRTLVLRANQMGPGVGVALGEALRGSSTLQRLTLGTNQIGDAGAKAIGEALRENGSLTALDLGDNQIAEDGAAAIAASLSCTTSLVSLALGSNRVGEKGAAAIASGLLRTTSLARLVLTANRIGPKGCLDLAESLRHNASITHLDLSANGVDDHAFAALVNVLGQSPLQSLRVKNNRITTIPLALAEARCLLSLDVSGNPLVHPSAEFVQQATFAQLQAHLRAHRSALSRLKLLVVGYQNAGKTCLCHALSRRPPFESLGQLLQRVGEDRSTHGIAIQAWRACKDPELNFNVFDFAGQPVYYSNHRNFLAQQQAVYVVVFRADLSDGGAEAQVRHWLNLIASQIDQRWRDLFVAGMAVKPAVIVVGTHVDQQQCTEALQEDHRAWFFALHQAQEYSQAVELHHQLLLIDHDHPATVDELRQWVVSTGRKQLERAPLGLDIVVNLFPRLDAIRHSATARPLFRTLLEFREVLLECNPQHPQQSIDDIGVEGLARSLQAMGELVLLEALGQVCVEPQRLFDMLAEFVQRQTAEMRDRDKQHVDHDMGIVTLQAIKAVCNRHNLKANLAVVSAESVVAALEMLDLCVEVKPGLYLFPSLLPDATSRRLLKNFFRDPVFRFDVQWQLESLHPINPQQSSSSSSSSSS
ncbi:MAG: hypothetical protein Q8P67_03940, partial [archaeon]|nr:hypothetical protein [archaeon]